MDYQRDSWGFTLIEIMIVVAIIGVLSVLAIPSLMKAREGSQRAACITTLRVMAGAKQMAAMDNKWPPDASATTLGNPYYKDTISLYLREGVRPICPTGAACFFNALDKDPTCQSGIPSHVYKAD